jgi:hypothetical protein
MQIECARANGRGDASPSEVKPGAAATEAGGKVASRQ